MSHTQSWDITIRLTIRFDPWFSWNKPLVFSELHTVCKLYDGDVCLEFLKCDLLEWKWCRLCFCISSLHLTGRLIGYCLYTFGNSASVTSKILLNEILYVPSRFVLFAIIKLFAIYGYSNKCFGGFFSPWGMQVWSNIFFLCVFCKWCSHMLSLHIHVWAQKPTSAEMKCIWYWQPLNLLNRCSLVTI